MAERVPAYEGDSPYIFISYAHKDSDSVMRVLDVMQSRGYRFWYDDGIVPGSEWPEYIAAHLDKAAVVVAFISDNSVKSSNCRREITFALSRNKPFISVFLEETELPLGLELQLSSAQSVLKHNFNTEEAFWDKLCTTPILEPCKMQPAQTDSWLTADAASEQAPIASSEHTQDAAPDFSPISGHDSNLAASPELALNADSAANPEPASTADSAADPEPAFTADSVADPEPASIADSAADLEPAPTAASGSATAPAASSEQAPAASSEPAPARHTDTASPASAGKPAKKNKNIKIILLAAVIAAAVLVRIVLFTSMAGDNNSNITNENGKLSVSNENVTQKTISSINRAWNLERLYFENCSFDEGVLAGLAPRFNEDPVISFCNCTGVDNLSFLSKCDRISTLRIENSGLADGVVPDLSEVPLFYLYLTGNPELTQLTLNTEKLYEVDLSGTSVENLDFLTGAEELRILNLENTNVSDLSPIAPLTRITYLNLSGSQVKSFETELNSLGLTELYLDGCGLTSSDGLGDYVALKKLDLGDNSLTDVTFIDKIAPNLELLDLCGNDITGSDLAFLQNANNMVHLEIDSIDLSECQLSYLENMTELSTLDARNCHLTDISGLQNCTRLKNILLGFNEINDVSALASLDDVVTSNRLLDLTNNRVESIDPLNAAFSTLLIAGNPDVVGVGGVNLKVYRCIIDYYDGLENSDFLISVWGNLYVSNCPRDKQLEVTKKEPGAVFCTRAEQLEVIKSTYHEIVESYEFIYLKE